jgi:hypothetical protein
MTTYFHDELVKHYNGASQHFKLHSESNTVQQEEYCRQCYPLPLNIPSFFKQFWDWNSKNNKAISYSEKTIQHLQDLNTVFIVDPTSTAVEGLVQ